MMRQGVAKSSDFPKIITVGYIPTKYVFEASRINGSWKLGGIEARFLNLLSKALRFEYRLKAPPDGESGAMSENGSWTGLIGMLQRKEIDIAFNFLTITEERVEVVDFSEPYEVNFVTFLVDKPGVLSSYWSFLYPFDTDIWICISLLLLVWPKVMALLGFKVSYLRLLFHVFGSLLRQPFTVQFSSTRNKILLLSWIVFSMVTALYYSSILLSFLTIPLQKAPLKTFVQLSRAVRKGIYRCLTVKGSSMFSLLETSKQKHLNYLSRAIEDNKWFYGRNNDLDNIRDSLIKTAVIDNHFKLQLLHHTLKHDSYVISEDVLITANFAVALRKDFCCKKRLNSVISSFRCAGLYGKLQKEEILRVYLSRGVIYGDENSLELTISDLYGAFILFVAGCILSLTVLLCELLYFRLSKRH
ncbi:Glutamate receptor ionotropic, delta-1 [Araneus ventricosus]|uniref:Glutamate receptor ionotropic, delta-1 n=1 Tax=Araneus ventricosus TaxID=182803 RepID=A0A4Y2FQ59_ARAVE|nr:Glutamate receptor ionotropic, delta-1 [Araneus ventricosus]